MRTKIGSPEKRPAASSMLFAMPAILAGLFVCWAASPAGATTYTVGVDTFKFVPPTLTIAPGDSVHWHLIKGTHTVTAGTNCLIDSNPIFNVQMFPSHPDFTYGFVSPGVYNYFCQLHCISMGMMGTITVQDNSAAPSETDEPSALQLRMEPNPARGAASLRFNLVQPGRIRFEILDPAGRTIRALDAGALGAGPPAVAWDGTDTAHRPLPTGVYFVRGIGAGIRAESRFVMLR